MILALLGVSQGPAFLTGSEAVPRGPLSGAKKQGRAWTPIGLFSVVFFVKRTTCQSQNLRKRATASPVVGLTEARKILGVVAPTQPRNYVVGDAR